MPRARLLASAFVVLGLLVAPTQLIAKTKKPQAVASGIAAPAASSGIATAPSPQTRAAPAGPTAQKAAAGSVTITDFQFGPKTITVHAGDTVTWNNKGPTAHSAIADNGSFDTGVFSAGGSRSQTFASPGTFPYHCAPHPFMTGTVKVLASSSSGGGKSSGSGSSGSSGSSSSSAPATTATPAASSPAPGSSSSASGSLASTGFDPLPVVAVGLLLLAAGVAIKGRRPGSGSRTSS